MLDKTPLLALGFRPFYLLAALFAVVAIPLWILTFLGFTPAGGYLHGLAWHSHEMIFGFAAAVIAGFLFTAVRNWTGRPTPTGGWLAAFAALWLLARLLVVTDHAELAAVVDVLFLPAVGIAVAYPIIASRNTRNYKVLAVIFGLTLANVVYHLANLDVLPPRLGNTGTVAALDCFAILIAIIGGRVTPAFISNAIQESRPRHVAAIEFLSFGTLLVILALGILSYWISVSTLVWTGLFVIAAVAQVVRLALWQPWRARSNPLLLMLPVAYLWLPVSLLLRATAAAGLTTSSMAFHALTVGAIASLMMAMMTRSSLGHSGRGLVAGWAEITAFGLLQLSALVRIAGGSILTAAYLESLAASAVLWVAAFAAFLWRYLPILTQPRIDGRPG